MFVATVQIHVRSQMRPSHLMSLKIAQCLRAIEERSRKHLGKHLLHHVSHQCPFLVVVRSILQGHLKNLLKTAIFFKTRPHQGSHVCSDLCLLISSCSLQPHVCCAESTAAAVTAKVYLQGTVQYSMCETVCL